MAFRLSAPAPARMAAPVRAVRPAVRVPLQVVVSVLLRDFEGDTRRGRASSGVDFSNGRIGDNVLLWGPPAVPVGRRDRLFSPIKA